MLGVDDFGLRCIVAASLRWLQGSHIFDTALADRRCIKHVRARIHEIAHLGHVLLVLNRLEVLHLRSGDVSSASRCRSLRGIFYL